MNKKINSKGFNVIKNAIILFIFLLLAPGLQAKTKTARKVQEVNFSEMSLKGTVRNPEGAFLVQKKGIKFLPLYDVKKDMDEKIRDSAIYVK